MQKRIHHTWSYMRVRYSLFQVSRSRVQSYVSRVGEATNEKIKTNRYSAGTFKPLNPFDRTRMRIERAAQDPLVLHGRYVGASESSGLSERERESGHRIGKQEEERRNYLYFGGGGGGGSINLSALHQPTAFFRVGGDASVVARTTCAKENELLQPGKHTFLAGFPGSNKQNRRFSRLNRFDCTGLINAFSQAREKSKQQRKMKNIVKVVNVVHRLIEFVMRGLFLLVAYLSGPAESQPPIRDLILMHSATTLALKIRNRQLSSEQVVRSYIERIKEIQPILNCVAECRFEDALKEAKQYDELLMSPNGPSAEVLAKEKPFLGVPFSTKDCLAVEKMKQTAGLVARKNYRADKDADSIKLMRLAGAIPIATTNVSELAMWWESTNYIYGTSKNPYNTRHIVGGSSGGEGCLQGAAGSAFGIGSDIGGSIRMPSFFNGIFGHKPSKGIVSNRGQYPSADTVDQDKLLAIGPMCRFAEDLGPILQVIADKNADKLKLQSKVDMSKLKIYYMEDDGGQLVVSSVDPEIRSSMRQVVNYFEKAYGVKAKKVNIRKFKKSLPLWFACMSTEPNKDFLYELSNRTGQINLFWEYVKWFTFQTEHTLISLLTASVERLNVSHGSEFQAKLKEQCIELQQEFKDMLGDDGIFLYPTHPTAAPLHYEPMAKPLNFSYTAIINVLGLPATACPLGLNKEGLPIGLQVVSGLYQDHITLAVAEELQRGFGGWVPPPIDD